MAFHTRFNSFPSRPHPIVQEVDEHLSRLGSSEAPSTSSLSINHNLSSLRDFYGCVDSTAKDAVLQTKAYIQDLQSIIRRTRGGESGALTREVNKYLSSRKIVKKAIQKAMKNLKGIESKSTFFSLSNNAETAAIFSRLREVEAITLAVFESLLSFISGPKSKPGSWSLVSKMVPTKKVICEEETEENKFAQVDVALHKTSKSENVQNQLEKLKSCIQDQEGGLESLFRQLIKTRVSLLNILNH
ncbi:uncharacterized protein [Pyrus communis]|uniref:uncharacterized protein n=1 Tax=Pyrus communis TaxID=23211 RepID=UPI0035BF40C1